MKKFALLIPVCLALLASCGGKTSGNDSGSDSLALADSINAEANDEFSADKQMQLDSASYHYETKYAVVDLKIVVPVDTSKVSKTIAKGIWRGFDESVTTSYGDGKRLFRAYSGDYTNIRKVVAYYGQYLFKALDIESRELLVSMKEADETGEQPDVEPMQFARDVSVQKVCDLENHVVFSVSWYGYAGGAHGGSAVSCLTFDKHTGKRVKEVLPWKAEKQLQKEMRKGLCTYFGCKDKELNDNLLLEDENSSFIPLPQESPYLTKDGVAFVYQQYEIAPYAAGMPTFVIPYDKVKDLLLVEP